MLQIRFIKSLEEQAFLLFYDRYAPKLWGCILLANLPISQAETILINTFRSAWKQLEKPVSVKKNYLTQLLHLAYQQGLPTEALRTTLLASHGVSPATSSVAELA